MPIEARCVMRTYRIETTVLRDKTISLRDLPFAAGDRVEVVIRKRPQEPKQRYPLRGKPVRYVEPFKSVAENQWEVLR